MENLTACPCLPACLQIRKSEKALLERLFTVIHHLTPGQMETLLREDESILLKRAAARKALEDVKTALFQVGQGRGRARGGAWGQGGRWVMGKRWGSSAGQGHDRSGSPSGQGHSSGSPSGQGREGVQLQGTGWGFRAWGVGQAGRGGGCRSGGAGHGV